MNWLKATKEVFAEYGITITTERQLSDKEYIRHFELSDPVAVLCHLDSRVTLFTHDAMTAYIEFCEPSEDFEGGPK